MPSNITDPIPAAPHSVEFFHRVNHILVRIKTTHGDTFSLSLKSDEAAALGQTLLESSTQGNLID
jgi:hypothetical protein